MGTNSIFNLVNISSEVYKNSCDISKKSAKSGESYLLISSKVNYAGQLNLGNEEYILQNWHVSVYENLRKDEKRSAYHTTFAFMCDKKEYFLRVYFDEYNNILFFNLKNLAGEVLPVFNHKQQIYQFALAHVNEFYKLTWDNYNKLHNEKLKVYDELVEKLAKENSEITSAEPGKKLEKIKITKNLVQEILSCLNQWYKIELSPDRSLLKYFSSLEKSIDNRVVELTATIRQEIKVIDNQLTELSGNLQKPWELIIKRHKLLKNKIQLLESGNNLDLDLILELRVLEKSALQELLRLLLPNSKYSSISEEELNDLISVIPHFNQTNVYIAVNNGRTLAIKLIYQKHPYINLDFSYLQTNMPGKSIRLLELAYQNKNIEMLKMLLELGVECECINTDGYTLLMRACLDEREQEMVALLEAGASSRLTNFGYNSLGFLGMSDKKEPNLHLISEYLKHCSVSTKRLINILQGATGQQLTLLHFACQKGWNEAVKLYLQQEADATIPNNSNLFTALDICAAKGYSVLCNTIFEFSKHSLDNICVKALSTAEKYRKQDAAATIKHYMKNKGISRDKVGITIKPSYLLDNPSLITDQFEKVFDMLALNTEETSRQITHPRTNRK